MRRVRTMMTAALAMVAAGMSTSGWAASRVEVLENYSPVRVAAPTPGTFFYASPSFAAYRSNVMQGLIQGLDAFGPDNSPTRFQAFDSNRFSIYETTGTPFNSWLGTVNPGGAYAGEFGTHIRAAVRVTSDTAFTINDVLYSYSDDIGNNFSATFGALNFGFSQTFVGLTAGGDLLDAASDARLQPIVALYFFGFANINVSGRMTPQDFAASGQTTDQFFAGINDLYVGDPYSFRDSYDLILNGTIVASDALQGDIVELAAVPEPASWALMIAGFAIAGLGLRLRPGVSGYSRTGSSG